MLANKLGCLFIDSGAIYRAGARKILDELLDVTTESTVADVFHRLSINFKVKKGETHVYLDGQDITKSLHDLSVTKIVPIVAAYPHVREIVKVLQHRLAQDKNIVMIGRDIGSEIFPEAQHKFYLDATPETRARRRFEQLRLYNKAIKYENVLNDMLERDRQDQNREVSPMRIPKGAIIIDTSHNTVEQTVQQILEHLN